jgi:hypothetical protein
MSEVKIRNRHGDFLVLLDEEDYEDLRHYKWHVSRVNKYNIARAYISEVQKYIALHTLIMKPPKGFVVDHINHNPLDNRRSNLRIVTQHQNTLNRTPDRSLSPYTGVFPGTRGFYVEIKKSGKKYRITWFNNAEEARDVHRRLLEFLIGKEQASILDTIA